MKQIEYNREEMQWRRRTQAGQSAIVAVIVLFLLLFIAAIFISIVAGNLKNTRVAANVSAAGRFAEAGINYLDQQLTNSPEGADWRPVPDATYGIAETDPAYKGPSTHDPDFYWLRPCGTANNYNPCGFTRVPFGGEVSGNSATAAQSGGRALVRVTYQPGAIDPHTGRIDPLSRYIKLETVGRVGQINENDPTTFSNTEGLSQRVELVAYKALGLNEYVRNITNKDNKPTTVTLGFDGIIKDRSAIVPLESVYIGAVHVNAPLTFYGVNRFIFNPYRNDALEVAGPIQLNDVQDTATTLNAQDQTRVYISVLLDPNNPWNPNVQPVTIMPATLGGQNAPPGTPSVFPSTSLDFTTLGPDLANVTANLQSPQNVSLQLVGYALVRDNPRGGDNASLPTDPDQTPQDPNHYNNLRTISRQAPPVIDNTIGDNGLTRYRALTRDSAPLAPRYVGQTPLTMGANLAGLYGWGQGMYIANTDDVQPNSAGNLINSDGYTLRADWLNSLTFTGKKNWSYGDQRYTPPAVTITLYPRYMVIDSSDQTNQRYLRDKTGARLSGRIVRYTKLDANDTPPTAANANQLLEGYPATTDPDGIPASGDETQYYSGDFVIYAEGNVRIRGVIGGYDAESQTYYKRHLTVVSNGTIYIDGNLIRDNILANDNNATAAQVRGQSTIALLAKDYIAVNTTQFFAAQANPDNAYSSEQGSEKTPPFALTVKPGPEVTHNIYIVSGFGPIFAGNAGFTIPGYLTGAANAQGPTWLVRHATVPEDKGGAGSMNIFMTLNSDTSNYFDFNGGFSPNTPQAYTLSSDDGFTMEAFALPTPVLYPIAGGNGALGLTNYQKIYRDNATELDYRQSRAAIVPSDIRIEAMMYAQEGSFFIIPGPWFNPLTDDTFEQFQKLGYRALEFPTGTGHAHVHTNPLYPFYGEPLDVRITFCGSINENLPAEVGDQSAWMEKWGWIPTNYGSTGLTAAPNYPDQGNTRPTMHGPNSPIAELRSGSSQAPLAAANGIVYEFDDRSIYPYAPSFSSEAGRALRVNPYNPTQPLPFAPRLPVAPGLLYYGQSTVR